MKIHLHPSFCLHEAGQRENNEDCIYPSKEANNGQKNNHLFLVCDGVGGAAKGEEASQIVCEILADQLENGQIIREEAINEAISLAEGKIDGYIDQNEGAHGMATTLTLLALHEEGATIAHIGDSRVYQIRDGQIIFKTFDHSYVNELVAKNIISEEQSINHPKRNIITKAIMGRRSPQQADVTYIKDIQAEDYFFLCTDGILESVPDADLTAIINDADLSNAEKIETIKYRCGQHSKDNFSAYLVQVERVEDGALAGKRSYLAQNNPRLDLYVLLLFIIGVLGLIAFFRPEKTPAVEEELGIIIDTDENTEASMKMLEMVDTNEIGNSPVDLMGKEDSTIDNTAILEQKALRDTSRQDVNK